MEKSFYNNRIKRTADFYPRRRAGEGAPFNGMNDAAAQRLDRAADLIL
jgi:hypothetical protein